MQATNLSSFLSSWNFVTNQNSRCIHYWCTSIVYALLCFQMTPDSSWLLWVGWVRPYYNSHSPRMRPEGKATVRLLCSHQNMLTQGPEGPAASPYSGYTGGSAAPRMPALLSPPLPLGLLCARLTCCFLVVTALLCLHCGNKAKSSLPYFSVIWPSWHHWAKWRN